MPHPVPSILLKMRRWCRWADLNEPRPPTTMAHYVDHPFASVTVDPASDSGAASFNRNRIRLWGGEAVAASDLDNMAALFDAQGVRRFFVWLNPGPGIALVHEWLASRGAVQIPWTRYPTMVHSGQQSAPRPATTVEVRKVTRRDMEVAAPGADVMPGGYLETLGRAGFHHFAAYESGRLIATAGLTHWEDMAYLNGAQTAEPFRRRGAQTALIAARIDEAHRLGCALIVTETLTMLPSSFANLVRAGFEVAYEKEVFECVKGDG